MIEINSAFNLIIKGINDKMNTFGFTLIKPDGISNTELPLTVRDSAQYLTYKSEKGTVRILFNENKIRFLTGSPDASSTDDSDFTLIASYLLIPDEYDERDVKSLINELNENIEDTYGAKAIAKKKASDIKAQATVTRSQIKSGASLYDCPTLAIKLSSLYPELKDYYKENVAEYGEFLCEDFFENYANKLIWETIRGKDNQKIKKLFNILNDVYDDGSNDVQDVIAVTVLGQLPTEDLHKILDLLGDNMVESVIRVNNIINKSSSVKMRLANPPKYKPKKKKKSGGLLSSMMGDTGNIQQ